MTAIDEDWLVEALHDLGTAIEVPPDGPARVLAARGQVARVRSGGGQAVRSWLGRGKIAGGPIDRPRRDHGSRRRQLLAGGAALLSLVVIVVSLVSLAGGGATSSTTTAASVNESVGSNAHLSDGGVASSGAGTAKSALPSASAAAPAQSDQAAPVAPAGGVSTKIIKSGSVDLQVGRGQLSPTVDQLTSLAKGLGGYVADAKTSEGNGAPVGDLSLRVPVDQFETLLTRTRALGKPTAVSTSGQDVTAAYVDLDARIQALQDTRTQYLQILAKATAIGDILSVEQQLGALQTQIEQLQGQQKVLADQTSFGTLSVHLSEPGSSSGSVAAPPGGLSKAWDHARHSFAHGIESVVGASGGLLVFLLFAGVVLLLARLAWPIIRRRLV